MTQGGRRGVGAAAWLGVLFALGLVPVAASAARVPALSDEVPLFVGPATLELSGGRGTEVWDEVRFGAHEIVLLLSESAPADGPCSTRVRLPAAGVPEDAADDTALRLTADPEARTIDATRLTVDYATSRLRIDSDCPEWSLRLMPLADPDLPYVISRRTYPIRGSRLDELAAQTHDVRGSFAAYTRWDTDWRLWLVESAAGCELDRAVIGLQARVLLPVWRRPEEASPSVLRRWRRFLDNLETHELGHITIALQSAHAIDALLDEGLQAPTCEQVTRRANRAATQLHERWERVNARYDQRTEHGLRQGTGLR